MRSSAGQGPRRKERVRCAIYTRKSSEEGPEQEFNSLQAQREACEAFIASQRHEGWILPACRLLRRRVLRRDDGSVEAPPAAGRYRAGAARSLEAFIASQRHEGWILPACRL